MSVAKVVVTASKISKEMGRPAGKLSASTARKQANQGGLYVYGGQTESAALVGSSQSVPKSAPTSADLPLAAEATNGRIFDCAYTYM